MIGEFAVARGSRAQVSWLSFAIVDADLLVANLQWDRFVLFLASAEAYPRFVGWSNSGRF